MIKPQTRIRVDFASDCSIGPGKISLLEGIDRTGSLSATARDMGMSYRRAWLLLHSTNQAFEQAVAELSVGGRDGGGARLTDFGRSLVAQFRQFEREVNELAARRFGHLRATGRPAPGQGIARPVRELAKVAGSRTRKKRRTG